MTAEQNFLIAYGLHSFVTFAELDGKHTFTIQSEQSQKMIDHAKSLIEENYGSSTQIQIS